MILSKRNRDNGKLLSYNEIKKIYPTSYERIKQEKMENNKSI